MELYFFSYWQIPENKKTLHYSCLLLSTYFLKILCYSFWIPQILCYKILLDLGFFHIDILYNVQYILPMHHCKVKSFIHGRNINLTDSRYAIKFDVCNIYFPLEKIEPLYLFHHAISTSCICFFSHSKVMVIQRIGVFPEFFQGYFWWVNKH